MLRLQKIVIGLAAFVSISCFADPASPVGNWKNISDKTNKVEAVIQIWDESGVLHGKITKLFDPKETICTKCSGDKLNKPLVGMEILWGAKKDGDEWTGGQILDAAEGNIYSVKLAMLDGGQKLKVRGFLGISLFGRTQIWVREE